METFSFVTYLGWETEKKGRSGCGVKKAIFRGNSFKCSSNKI